MTPPREHRPDGTPTPDTLLTALVPAVLRALQPERLLERHAPEIQDRIRGASELVVVAMGKGSRGLARAIPAIITGAIDPALVRGAVASVPEHAEQTELALRGAGLGAVDVLPTDHPAPTERNLDAADRIASLLRSAAPGGHVLAMISGGGSAQLASPRPPLTLGSLRALSAALMRAGADIHELNCVRRHLERLKNGGLLRCVGPEIPVTAVVLADVPPPTDAPTPGAARDAVVRTVSSGPFHPGSTTPEDARAVLDRYALLADFPVAAGALSGAPGHDRARARPVHTIIAGDNARAVDAGAGLLGRAGIGDIRTQTGVTGEAEVVGRELARAAAAVAETIAGDASAPRAPVALVWGGETTVTVRHPDGLGGPCQHLALACALELDRLRPPRPVGVLALATDGRDGPTNGAGGVVHDRTAAEARAGGLDPDAALASDNAHPVLRRMGRLLVTGPAGTNLNDLMIAIIDPPPPPAPGESA